jgi:hypothetical protein
MTPTNPTTTGGDSGHKIVDLSGFRQLLTGSALADVDGELPLQGMSPPRPERGWEYRLYAKRDLTALEKGN